MKLFNEGHPEAMRARGVSHLLLKVVTRLALIALLCSIPVLLFLFVLS